MISFDLKRGDLRADAQIEAVDLQGLRDELAKMDRLNQQGGRPTAHRSLAAAVTAVWRKRQARKAMQ
jgi:hypothetical protein